MTSEGEPEEPIAALLPRGQGEQFVLYGDACSGVPGALHEGKLAAVNAVIRRLAPQPEFIIFPGDEIIGLVADPEELRAQWRHFLQVEMGWLDRKATPIWHATGNHTAYDEMSEAVFREMLDQPRNGPPGQEGLSYWVRREDLLMVFVHTLWTGLGGEGHVETEWLRQVLSEHEGARHKLVIGHHPVHPINGFTGAYQREIGPEHAGPFWDILVEAKVLAYVCSHILAFDIQVHRGVLQLCTAGAGTAHRMPEGVEYLHCVQAALDAQGLRYQVLDIEGHVRERLDWPMAETQGTAWRALPLGESQAAWSGGPRPAQTLALRFTGEAAPTGTAGAQTLLAAFSPGQLAKFWVGLSGPSQRLTVIIGRETGRSPSYWLGRSFAPGEAFDIELVIHPDMGPGGILAREARDQRWSSLAGASAHGPERLDWPERWSVGHGPAGAQDRRFGGAALWAMVAAG
ncbi:Calcineurin-like phosphoesterase [Rhizobiales bacterium GAS113]|nr:Calcineurin-like phosphoesterase [Rhizobiales bacterium GAS113]